MKLLEEYSLKKSDWIELTKAIQAIQEDKASVTIWLNQVDISRWLHTSGKIDAVRELCNERKNQII